MSQSYQQIVPAGGAIACPSSEQLLAFASGDVDEYASASIAQHIAACPNCEVVVRTMDGSADPLASRMRLALQGSAELDESECFRMMRAAVELGAYGQNEVEQPATHSLAGTPEVVSDVTRYQSLPTESWTPVPLGETIGRYRLESLIGEGTYGRVYLAHDPQLDRPVALKIAKSHELGDASLLVAFVAEARSAARLRHPGIVTIHEVGCAGEFHFIAMEYVPGRSLRELLVGQPQPAELVADVVGQVAVAIHYAHKMGLMHRDLKPANLLLDADGRVRIADFGLALHEDQQRKRAGDRAGTLAYMPPEQVRGNSHRLDGRADIWSLGVIMYELLAGRRPFRGGHRELEDEILHRLPKPLRQIRDDIDSRLEQICLKCLAKSPEERYSSAKDLAEALLAWRGEKPAKRPKPPTWPLVAAAALLVVLASVPAVWIASRPQHPYQVDRYAKANRSLELLTQEPEVIDAQKVATKQTWDYDPQMQQITMTTGTLNMLGLGETHNDSFKLQVKISKIPRLGTAGLFIGCQPLPPDGGRRGWKCQTIQLAYREDGILEVQRIQVTLIENAHGSFNRKTYSLHSVSLPGWPPQRSELEVTVDRVITEVRWDGMPLRDLADPQIDEHGNVPGCTGRFGLVNARGTTTFSEAKFTPLGSPPP